MRKIPGGTQLIGVPIVDYRPRFAFSLPVSMRIEQVEDIFNRFSGSAPAYHTMTLTTMTPFAYFYGEPRNKQFQVESDQDIDAAVESVAPVLRDRIMPFLDSHQDIKALDAVMHSPDGDRFDRSNPPYRQMHSLILAKLAGNPHIEALAARYLDEARAFRADDQKKLTDLVTYLQTL